MRFSPWLVMGSAMILAVAVAFHPETSQAAPKVGVASAVKNDVRGTVGGSTRSLSAGSEVFTREVVRTGEASSTQLLFLDETTLAVGPQSEVTLDRFVFDPSRNTGKVSLNLTRGAFRFITGSQASTNYEIKTPVATIGVRGTIAWLVSLDKLPAGPIPLTLPPGQNWMIYVPSGAVEFTIDGKVINLKAPEYVILSSITGLQGPFKWASDINQLFDSGVDLTNILNATGNPCPYQCDGGNIQRLNVIDGKK